MNISLEPSKTVLQVIDRGNVEKSAKQSIPETGLQESLSFHQVLGAVHGEGIEPAQLKIEIEVASLEKNALNDSQGVRLPGTSLSSAPMMYPVLSEPQKQVINQVRSEIEIEENITEKNTVSDFQVTRLPTTPILFKSFFYPGAVEPHAVEPDIVASQAEEVEPVRLKAELKEGASEKNVTPEFPESRDLEARIPLEKMLADHDASTVIEEEPRRQSNIISEDGGLSLRKVKKNSSGRVSVQKTVQENEPGHDAIRVDPLSMTGFISPERSEIQLKPVEAGKKLFHQEAVSPSEVQESPLLNPSETGILQGKKQGPILSSVRSPKEGTPFQVQNQDQAQNQNGLLRSAFQNDHEMGKDTLQSMENPFDSKQLEVMDEVIPLEVTDEEIPQSVPETNRERLHPSQTRRALSETNIEKKSEQVVLDIVHPENTSDVNKAGDETTEPFPGEMVETSEAISRVQIHRNFTASNPVYTSIQAPSPEHPEGLINLGQKESATRPTLDVIPDVLADTPMVSGVTRERSASDLQPKGVVDTNPQSTLLTDEPSFQNGPFDQSVETIPGNLEGRTVSESMDAPYSPDLKVVLPQDHLIQRGNSSTPVVRPLEPALVLNDPLLHEIQVAGVEEMTVSENRGVFFPIENASKRHLAQVFSSSLIADSSITENNAPEIEEVSKAFQDRSAVFSAIDLFSSAGEKDIQKAVSAENKFHDLKSVLPNEEAILRQVSDQIRLWKPGKETTIRLQLEPETLGSLQIEMRVEDKNVIARIVTEDVAVKGLIERNQDLLRQGLEAQGFKIERFSVDVGGMARSFDQKGSESFSDRKAQTFYPPKENDSSAQNQALRSNVTRNTIKRRGMLNLYA